MKGYSSRKCLFQLLRAAFSYVKREESSRTGRQYAVEYSETCDKSPHKSINTIVRSTQLVKHDSGGEKGQSHYHQLTQIQINCVLGYSFVTIFHITTSNNQGGRPESARSLFEDGRQPLPNQFYRIPDDYGFGQN